MCVKVTSKLRLLSVSAKHLTLTLKHFHWTMRQKYELWRRPRDELWVSGMVDSTEVTSLSWLRGSFILGRQTLKLA